MVKYMRKCRAIGELALMEASQVVGVRTRAMTTALAAATKAAKKRKIVGSAPEFRRQVTYLELRSRRLLLTPQIPRSAGGNSDISRCLTPEGGQISRCSSNASCEVELPFADREVCERLEKEACCSDLREEIRETTPSINTNDYSYDLESTAERREHCSSTALITPSDEEIEEFFAAAEMKETQRFAKKYNYDVVNDVPLEGRYYWIQVAP